MIDVTDVRMAVQDATYRLGAAALLALCASPPVTAAGYAPDPSFNGGQYYVDAFASDGQLPDHDYSGRRIAQAANGDLIVAALVDERQGAPDQHMAVGLIRYNAAGVRVPWSNPDPATARYHNNYLFVPQTNDVGTIDDLRIIDDKIVLVYSQQIISGLPEATIGAISVISDAGRMLSSELLYFDGSSQGVRGGAVALYREGASTYAAVVGTHLATKRPYYDRFRIDSNGSLTPLDAAYLNTSACWNPAWQCDATAIAISQDIRSLGPRIYVAYTFRAYDGDDADVVVSRIDEHGNGDPGWDPNNVHWNISDGGSGDDIAVGVAVRRSSPLVSRDQIYVATQSARGCQPGIGLIAFDHDGNRTGKALWGGNSSPLACFNGTAAADLASALVLDGDRLAVAARHVVSVRRLPTATDSEIASFDLTLAALGAQTFPFPIGAPRQRDSEGFGAVRTAAGVIALTGDLIFPATAGSTLAGKQQVGTLRVRYQP